MNRSGQSETAQPLPFGFEAGIPRRAPPLPLFFELHPAKEIGEGTVQISQSLLWSALADFVHPGQCGLLEVVQLPMQFQRADAPACGLIDLLLALESPIVGVPCCPSVHFTGGNLLVIYIEFRAIAPCDLHP